MKNRFGFFVCICCLLSLTSCIEVLDDIQLNLDGSGTLKYNINLSASKVKINSLLALDSLEGKKVPSLDEIKEDIARFKAAFEAQPGISGVELETDFDNFLFKLSLKFESVEALQKAAKGIVEKEYKGDKTAAAFNLNWLVWSNEKLERAIPDFQLTKAKNLKPEEIELLKQGSYISITRFEKSVKSFTNQKAMLSKNKMAVMLRENAYSVSQNPKLLENTIYLSSDKP